MNNLDDSVSSVPSRCSKCSISDLCDPTDTVPYHVACSWSSSAVNLFVKDFCAQLKARSILVTELNCCKGNDFKEVVSIQDIEDLLSVCLEVFKS